MAIYWEHFLNQLAGRKTFQKEEEGEKGKANEEKYLFYEGTSELTGVQAAHIDVTAKRFWQLDFNIQTSLTSLASNQ